MPLHVEDIFDASTDDDAFAGLARRLAEEVGARSGVLHWRSPGRARESEMSSSGHFSAADMSAYDELPWGTDLWGGAVNQPAARNRVWLLEELVPAAQYKSSIVYNEWVRRIGDDTFHCLGGAIENDCVIYEIGLHRGRNQDPFDAQDLARIQAFQKPLLQMVKVRQHLFARRESINVMSSALDCLGTAILKLNDQGKIIYRNQAAENLLARRDGLVERDRQLLSAIPVDQRLLDQAISLAAAAKEPKASAIAIKRITGEAYTCSFMPVFLDGTRTTLVIIRDPLFQDDSVLSRLRAIYSLSEAEAHIAFAITDGATVDQIAAERATKVDTVRTQLKSLTAKMGCRRQNEVASRVRSLPLLNLNSSNGTACGSA